MRSILITGSTGFIGQHLIRQLLNSSYNINTVVRKVPHSPHQSIGYKVIKNVTPNTKWSKALEGNQIVIHLAARAHILKDEDPDTLHAFRQTNVDATLNLAKQAIDVGVKQFIFMSSIGAMASFSNFPLKETSACHPDTPYGISKQQAEDELINLIKLKPGMSITTLRPTLVYGPQNPGNMERLLKLVDKNLPLPLGSIENQRSLMFVGNLIDAIVQCIDNPNAYNQTFLLSDGHDISTPDLIKQIAHSLNKKPNLLPIPPKLLKLAGQLTGKSDTIDRLTGSLIVDSSKIRQTLNWTPPYTFQEGIKKTCDWYLQSR